MLTHLQNTSLNRLAGLLFALTFCFSIEQSFALGKSKAKAEPIEETEAESEAEGEETSGSYSVEIDLSTIKKPSAEEVVKHLKAYSWEYFKKNSNNALKIAADAYKALLDGTGALEKNSGKGKWSWTKPAKTIFYSEFKKFNYDLFKELPEFAETMHDIGVDARKNKKTNVPETWHEILAFDDKNEQKMLQVLIADLLDLIRGRLNSMKEEATKADELYRMFVKHAKDLGKGVETGNSIDAKWRTYVVKKVLPYALKKETSKE